MVAGAACEGLGRGRKTKARGLNMGSQAPHRGQTADVVTGAIREEGPGAVIAGAHKARWHVRESA